MGSRSVSKCMVSVCAHECVGLVGRQQWQLVEDWLGVRAR